MMICVFSFKDHRRSKANVQSQENLRSPLLPPFTADKGKLLYKLNL